MSAGSLTGSSTGSVTPKIADLLRRRMRRSSAIFFATLVNSQDSKRMSWEFGNFDGSRQGRPFFDSSRLRVRAFEGVVSD
jgi:hypothetical protein